MNNVLETNSGGSTFKMYLVVIAFLSGCSFMNASFSETVFSDDFESGLGSQWQSSGLVDTHAINGNTVIRVRNDGSIETQVDTTNKNGVTLLMKVGAESLEMQETCVGQVSTDAGQSWITLVSAGNGQDYAQLYQGQSSDQGLSNANLTIRLKANGAQDNDRCYLDDVVVTADSSGPIGPEVSVQSSILFASKVVGQQDLQTVSFTNSGDQSLSVSSITPPSSPFAVVADSCSGNSVSPTQSCQIDLSFAPTSVGYFSDDLVINGNGVNQPVIVNLTGSGLSEANDDFGALSGSGNVARSGLTYSDLTGSGILSQASMSSFALPSQAANPTNQFSGTLTLQNESTEGSFSEFKDTFRYTGNGDDPRKHLPEFAYEFVQTGSYLVPAQQGTIASSHPYWEYVFGVGRVWNENGDNGFSRASIPFALQQKNANCVHNGVMSFLFKDDGSVSRAHYSIASETCLYYQFDMWGTLSASYQPMSVSNAATIISDYQQWHQTKIPVLPMSDLVNSFAGANSSEFGSVNETDPNDMTLFGLAVDGKLFTGGCMTRQGMYPFCDQLIVPSYSTAKTVFAGAALMSLEQQYPGTKNEVISDWVASCDSNGNWNDVSFTNASDMATGNYNLSGYMSDEGAVHTNDLFLSEDHSSKIFYSCNEYSRKASPGTQWVYHTSDTYLLGTALNNYLKSKAGAQADIFADTLVADIYQPLGTSKTVQVSRRTYDSTAQPFAGWGMTYVRDDIAKLALFMNDQQGQISGAQVLDSAMLNSAMQKNPADRGLSPLTDYKYKYGVWALDIGPDLGCSGELYVPFMSGYGGITVLMLPNGFNYFYFSDGDTYLWKDAAIEAHRLVPMCQ